MNRGQAQWIRRQRQVASRVVATPSEIHAKMIANCLVMAERAEARGRADRAERYRLDAESARQNALDFRVVVLESDLSHAIASERARIARLDADETE